MTGGGRGIGANISRALARDGWDVVVTARSRDQIDAVAQEIGGIAFELDVSDREAVTRVFGEIGAFNLLVANAGIGKTTNDFCAGGLRGERARRPPLLRGGARVIVGMSSHRHHGQWRGVPARQLDDCVQRRRRPPLCRYAETLNNAVDIPVFVFQPRTRPKPSDVVVPRRRAVDATGARTRLVRKPATGRYDDLAGRYLHAGARRRRRPACAHRRSSRARPERDPTAALKTLVCFGDSNAWGYVPGSDGERFPREQRWPVILQRLLGDNWVVISEGLGGRTATIDRPDSKGAEPACPISCRAYSRTRP